MKSLTFLSLYFILLSGFVYSNELVSKTVINSLVDEADAVVLSEEIVFTVTSDTEGEFYQKSRILIKNKNAQEYCELLLNGSGFVKIGEFDAAIIDTFGNILKELDDDDIKEAEFSPGYNLYSENTYKFFKLTHNIYPYIIEYSYIYDFETLFFWPDWSPQYKIPVLSSTYKLVLEDDIKYKTFSIGLDIRPVTTKENGDSVLIWKASNIPPVKWEDTIAPEDYLQNAILFSPIDFELGKTKGSVSSWDALASWYYNLAKKQYEIPIELETTIKNLIEGKSDQKEIIRELYKYMQEKTRYVAISLGIGGWQPHSVKTSYKNRYGDCKDLSTMMISMLDVAGIKAYPALALTRDEGIIREDFPTNQFNHCITFVPLEQDTIWLECTADFIEIEDTPYSIEGINVLVVNNNSGELIKTPQKAASKNKWLSISKGSLFSNGFLKFESEVYTTGNQKNHYQKLFGANKPKKIKEFLEQQLTRYISGVKISAHSINKNDPQSPYKIATAGGFKKFGNSMGKRIFINPNIYHRKTKEELFEEETREFPIYFNYPYVNIDSIAINLPYGYKLEAAPEKNNILTSFGQYQTNYRIQDGIFYYKRYIKYNSNLISPEFYSEYRDFVSKIVKSDQSKFIFKKI